MGDYSNCHHTLAKALRRKGHYVTYCAPDNGYNTPDINIKREKGLIAGIILFFKILKKCLFVWKDYDIVAINDPHFVTLRPALLCLLFNILKRNNHAVFYTAMSTDVAYLDLCSDKNGTLKFNEWFINGEKSPWYIQQKKKWDKWHSRQLQNYQNYFFKNIDGAIAVLYEYYEGLKYRLKSQYISYGGIPIDIKVLRFPTPSSGKKIRILLGRDKHRILMKGTDILEKAARTIADKYPDIVEFELVENLPYPEFIRILETCHIFLDQIYSYTPATSALLAMAMGKTVVSGAQSEYYKFINEIDNQPIIKAGLTIEENIKILEGIILNREFISTNAINCHNFVLRHNNDEIVADRFLKFWTNKLKFQP